MNKIYRITALLGMLSLAPLGTQAAPQIMNDAQLRAVSGQGMIQPDYIIIEQPRVVIALDHLADRLDQQGLDRAAQAIQLQASWLSHVLPPRVTSPHCTPGMACPL